MFPMKSSEFTKWLNFVSKSRKKNCKKVKFFLHFFIINWCFLWRKKYSVNFKIGSTFIDMIHISAMEPSELEISLSLKSYKEKHLKIVEIATMSESIFQINIWGTIKALSTLRGLRGAPEAPPLCRETQSLGQQMRNW